MPTQIPAIMSTSREDSSIANGPAEGSSSPGPMSQGLIAAIVVSAVAVLVVLVLTVIVCCRFAESMRLHKGKARSSRNGKADSDFENFRGGGGGDMAGRSLELDSTSGKYAASFLSGDPRRNARTKGRWTRNEPWQLGRVVRG